LLDKAVPHPGPAASRPGVEIRPPVYVDASAEIEASTIGPYVSLGPGCRVSGSRIEDSILDAGCTVRDASLRGSLVGARASVHGAGTAQTLTLNVGDDSNVRLDPTTPSRKSPRARRS
jgi:glucose-1-phosphate thymidylyltransferase